jgi:hypothetical protein
MIQKNLIVMFYLNRAKTNQKGICPIYCRITYLKKRKQFSTREFINPLSFRLIPKIRLRPMSGLK